MPRVKHDIWSGPIIEHYDTWTQDEPKRPARTGEGGIDIRKARDIAKYGLTEASLAFERETYLRGHSPDDLEWLEKDLDYAAIGQAVVDPKVGAGYITFVSGGSLKAAFPDDEVETRDYPFPQAFYNDTLRFATPDERKAILSFILNPPKKKKAKDPRKKKKAAKPGKPPKMLLKHGRIFCPRCGFEAQPGEGIRRCPRCSEKKEY